MHILSLFKKHYPYFLIATLGFLLYLPVVTYNFTYLDDTEVIVKNYETLHQPHSLLQAFLEDPAFSRLRSNYRPLLTISFVLDSLLMGDTPDPAIYHFTNIIIHLVASCLVFALFLRLKYPKLLSLVFSLVFTVHPLLTAAIAWIPGRNESLVAVFILAAFIQFLKYIDSQKISKLLLSSFFFLLGLLTKETAIAFPVLCLLYLSLTSKSKIPNLPIKILAASWILPVATLLILRHEAYLYPITEDYLGNFFSFPLVKASLFLQLIGKIFFPFHLSVYPHIATGSIAPGVIAILLLTSLLVISRPVRLSSAIFGWCWFFAFFLPIFLLRKESSIVYSLDHRIYLSFVGFLIFFMELGIFKKRNFTSPKNAILSGTFILGLSFLTLIHSFNYRNGLTFWQNAVYTHPHAVRSRVGLAYVHYLNAHLAKAEFEIQSSPGSASSPEAVLLHGLIYTSQKKYSEAETSYQILTKAGYQDLAYGALALLYYDQGKIDQAESYWQKALKSTPDPNLIQSYRRFQILAQNHTQLTPDITLNLILFYL